MRVICWLAVAWLAGCSSTTHSTLGPFVRRLDPVPGGVGVETCQLHYAHTTSYWSWNPWSISRDEDSTLDEEGCARSSVSTEVAP